ncbi:MAG TPA: hypothetical protein ENK18_05980 [Deltaproteobacteria bacterium]|nr:hypothetical protein [Deltaproteobacteria bacterium]
MRGAPEELGGLSRVVALPPGIPRCAVADGLVLLATALDPRALWGFDTLGWGHDLELVGESEPQLLGLDPAEVGATVGPGVQVVTIEAGLHLDPPLFGQLRAQAARDPRMVTALGQRPVLSVKVGWLLSQDRTAASPALLGIRIGDVAFETSGKERPGWLPGLCRDLAGRFARTTPLEPVGAAAVRGLEASLSPDPEARAGWQRVVALLQEPPFSLPEPGLVRIGGEVQLVFGPQLDRIRQIGRGAWDALRLVEAALLRRPDVLILDEVIEPSVAAWFASLPEAEQAPIEQVWIPGESLGQRPGEDPGEDPGEGPGEDP